VPVTLTATPRKTWGKLAGTVSGLGCGGTTTPLPGATIQVSGPAAHWLLTERPHLVVSDSVIWLSVEAGAGLGSERFSWGRRAWVLRTCGPYREQRDGGWR
jgi:hypothetical protein